MGGKHKLGMCECGKRGVVIRGGESVCEDCMKIEAVIDSYHKEWCGVKGKSNILGEPAIVHLEREKRNTIMPE